MVSGDGESVDAANWTPWQAALLERVALDPRVDRIFVNPAIKRIVCESVTTDRTWLRKISTLVGPRRPLPCPTFVPRGRRGLRSRRADSGGRWLRRIAGVVVFGRSEGGFARKDEDAAEAIDARRPAGRLPSHSRRRICVG